MPTFSDFIGEPVDLCTSLPSRRDVLRFISFVRVSQFKPRTARDVVLQSVADSLVQLLARHGFSVERRSVKRLVKNI